MKCLIQSRLASQYPGARLRIRQPFAPLVSALFLIGLLLWSKGLMAAPVVEVTVKPVHSLVSRVMQGVGEPGLLIDGTQSPHGASLRPTQAQALQRADLVFWVGPELESGMATALKNIARKARVVPLLRATIGLRSLPFRTSLPNGPDQHKGSEHGDKVHDKAHQHGHRHAGLDPHVWLDPDRAASIVETIAIHLEKVDPANASLYQENAAALRVELEQLAGELSSTMDGIAQHPVLVFHDAYQYFEQRFGLRVAAVVTFNPDIPSSASHIRRVREQVAAHQIRCAFSEPQFSPRAVRAVLSGTAVRLDVLDPLGAGLPAGSNHYPALMRALAKTASACAASS